MPRIAGVDLPGEKPIRIGLTYVFGIGQAMADRICKEVGIAGSVRVKSLSDEHVARLNSLIEKNYIVEGVLRRQIGQNIQRLKEIGCYRGLRHRRGLPVRGQRTRSNARSRKGPRKTVAGKKIAKA